MTPLERMAMAICAANSPIEPNHPCPCARDGRPTGQSSGSRCQAAVIEARAARAAIREPSEAMRSMMNLTQAMDRDKGVWSCVSVWQAAIDAALNEAPP